MFSSGTNYSKLKTNLRLAINRLKLLEKKKTELALKARKEIADYISIGKTERAKIRVEHIIREDYLVEAMEVVEMYCDLLLARFGLIEQMKDLDEGLAEAISSLLWVAPRLQTDVAELKIIFDQLSLKYGRPYAQACREQSDGVSTISVKLINKLSVHAPSKVLVEKYLIEIAKNYNLEYEPDPQVMREAEWSEESLIKLNDGGNDLGGNHGAYGGGEGGGMNMNIPPYPQPTDGASSFNYPPPTNFGHLQIPNFYPVPFSTIFVPSIFLTNPQSLNNCFEEFSVTVRNNDPDIVAVSETWFSDSHPAKNFDLDGYTMFHDDRSDRRGGGVALYVRTRLVPYSPSIKVPDILECIWAGIGSTLLICSLYHPPRASSGKLLLEHVVNTVLDIRHQNPNSKVILIGDFNELPHERLYSSLKLQNLVKEPTHQNSAIDLILTDVPHLYADIRLLPPIGNSQHHCVLALPVEKIGFNDGFNLPNVPGQPYLPMGPPPSDMSADNMTNNFKTPPGAGGPWGAPIRRDISLPPPYSSLEPNILPPASAPPSSFPSNIGGNITGGHRFPPDLSTSNLKESNQPKPAPRSKFDTDDAAGFNLPDLPNVPEMPGVGGPATNDDTQEDIDFDDLNKRFEELKRKK